MRRRRQSGFTLLELMVVVTIIGLLCSVAIPAFMRNERKAKTTEALTNVKKMYDGSRAYIYEERTARGLPGTPIATQFPSPEPISPAETCCKFDRKKCPPDPTAFVDAGWQALTFSVDDPHYYRYEYDSSPGNDANGPTFTARALGDLDCDNTYSTFEIFGTYDHGEVSGQAAIHIEQDIE